MKSIPKSLKYQVDIDLQNTLLNDPKHYLVTGGAGFIGSNIVEMLLRLNQRVTTLDNFSTGYEKNLAQVKNLVGSDNWKNHTLIRGDIRDPATKTSHSFLFLFATKKLIMDKLPLRR